jgi:hypothetical protein
MTLILRLDEINANIYCHQIEKHEYAKIRAPYLLSNTYINTGGPYAYYIFIIIFIFSKY